MKRLYILLYTLMVVISVSAQRDEVVQNRPYTDLRQMHLGIVVGTHTQDLEFENVGLQMVTLSDGTQIPSLVTCDQHNWDIGFNVGVLAEFRMNEYFAFRFAPQLYFDTRNLKFYNFNKNAMGAGLNNSANPVIETQNLRTVYIGADCDFIYAAKRHNNHRPYLMAGIAPMFNLSTPSNDYLQLKKNDVFFEIGMGCDFYLPFFKLRPELKFMLGLTNCLNNDHPKDMRDDVKLPYAMGVKSATSKMIVLSFYFE